MWPAAGAALQIAGAIHSDRQKRKYARKQRDTALRNYQFELQSLVDTSKEVNLKAGEEMSERARAAMFQRSRLAVIGSESGLEGNTADRLERQTFFDEGFDITMLDVNRQRAQRQIEREKEAATIRRDSTIAGIQFPSNFGLMLQIAGSVTNLMSGPSSTPSAQ
jgi:hypothetical protein